MTSNVLSRYLTDAHTLPYVFKSVAYWINLSDSLQEGTWVWNDTGRVADYTNWYLGEPNNVGGNEDCAVLSGSDFYFVNWYDVNCEKGFWNAKPICEIE